MVTPANRRRAQIDPNTVNGAVQAMKPTNSFRAVTPSDTVDIKGGLARSLYVGVAGNVVAINEEGTAILFTAVPAGSILRIVTSRVNSTSTTATAIVAL